MLASRYTISCYHLTYFPAVSAVKRWSFSSPFNLIPSRSCSASHFHCHSSLSRVMSSRRSVRVAALQSSKPAVSYKEVSSDDEPAAPTAEDETSGARGGSKQQRQNGPKAEATSEEQDDEVIVLDDGDADEVTLDDEVATAALEDEESEESATTSKKRKRVPAQQRKAGERAQSRRTAQQQLAEMEEDIAAVAEAIAEAAEEQETKSAKGKKRKVTTAKGKRGKKGPAGDVDDPIAVDDEEPDDDKPQTVKKPTKPKKEKQPSLLPHIRTVTTALDGSKKLIGAHVGTAGGVHFGPHNAALMGARCLALDTRSKRRWASAPYTSTIIESFHSNMRHYGYSGDVVLPHGSYLTNLGCLSNELWTKSKACIKEELERCEQLGVTNYVFHPGRASTSGEEREEEIRAEKEQKKLAREKARDKARERRQRLKAGEEVIDDDEEEADTTSSQPALDPSEYLFKTSTPAAVRSYITAQPAIRIRSLARLVTALSELLSPSMSATYPNVHILIETMAGVGNQLCSRFEEMRYVIDALDDPSRIGVCLDTCHVFAADERYDMRQRDGYERVMKEIEHIIGWQYIKGMHMNDSKCQLGSHRDRHENIGDGEVRHFTHTRCQLLVLAVFRTLGWLPRLVGVELNPGERGGATRRRLQAAQEGEGAEGEEERE